MFCRNCGAEITLTERFNKIVITYCEKCGRKISTMDLGQATEKEMAWLRHGFQEKFEREARGFEPAHKILARLEAKNVKMHHPDEFERPGKLVCWSSYKDKKEGTA